MWKDISEFGGWGGRFVVWVTHPEHGGLNVFAVWGEFGGWMDVMDDCAPIELDGWVVTKYLEIPDPE